MTRMCKFMRVSWWCGRAGAAVERSILVLPTAMKPDASPPMELEGLAEIAQGVTIPVVAIGGIETGNAEAVIQAGADGIAMVHAVAWAEDVAAAAQELLTIVIDALARRET